MPSIIEQKEGKSVRKTGTGTTIGIALLVSLITTTSVLYGVYTFYLPTLKQDIKLEPVALTVVEQPKEQVTYAENEDATISAVKKSENSVVSIVVKKEYNPETEILLDPSLNDPFFRFFGPGTVPTPETEGGEQTIARGTGFIVSPDGFILTNKHVVNIPDALLTVVLNDGTEYDAVLLDSDPLNDIAVLKIEATDLPAVTLGDSDSLQIGETVIAIGNSLGEYSNSITKGVVSAIDRSITASDGTGSNVSTLDHIIQTDAAINPGNSGGPLVNLRGEVVGINTAIDKSGQSIGFAIPINDAKYVVSSIKENGKVVRPFMGVRYLLINENIQKLNDLPVDHGALVIRGESQDLLAVIPGSPADMAGLKENDIILSLNDEEISVDSSLIKLLQKYKPGEEVELKVLSQGEEKTVKVTLGESN